MKGYKDLVEFCKELGLDPNKKGENKVDVSDYFIFEKALDLTELRPNSGLIEVMELGRMIRNLLSQVPRFKSYNFSTPSGMEDQMRDLKISDVCQMYNQIMILHVNITPGLAGRNLYVHNGTVYELNRDPNVMTEEIIKRTQNIIARYRDK